VPNNFLSRNKLYHLLPALVKVFVAISELGTNLISAAFDVANPPSLYVIDRLIGFFWRSAQAQSKQR